MTRIINNNNFIALKKSRNVIEQILKQGICSTYDRFLELTKCLSDNMTKQFDLMVCFVHKNVIDPYSVV